MAHENWQQVKEIFVDALRHQPEERPRFLDRVCSHDKTLRREVESLLSSFDSAEGFMETPALGAVADKVLTESRKFAKGQILGHYEIISQIGKGGMGDVYLANDSELQRRVALKILRENLSWESQAKQRLLREARAVAKLDHPNICAIYEISESDHCSFIVMQYVEGETLADILEKEPLSVEQSLDLAIQIADALEEAHSHQIIHRDIKPSNIVVNNKGQLKVLDFGLAKFIKAEADAETSKRLSSSGAIMGTVPFMSPEQLRGQRLDARTDIFSFGVMLYEMLSGHSPFQKDSNAEAISAILNDEPDWTKIPLKLRPILQKSLMKDKTGRYQTAKDLTTNLRNIRATAGPADEKFWNRIFARQTAKQKASPPRFYFWKSADPGDAINPETGENASNQKTKFEKPKLNYPAVFSVSLALCVFFGATIWLVWQFAGNNDSHSFDSLRPVRLVSWKTGASSIYSDYRASHDGKMIAYSATQGGANEAIYVKQTNGGADIPITRDEWKNRSPIWSPDDQRMAFVSFREGKSGIYVCPSLGGESTLLKVVGNGLFSLRHWSKDGSAIFYEIEGNLFRLDIATQEITQITNFAPTPSAFRFFSLSPDENEIAFADKTDGQTDLWVIPTSGGAARRLTNDEGEEMYLSWHPDGKRILYTVLRDNHYQINLAYRSGHAPKQITRGDNEYWMLDVSADGTKIFYLTWEYKSDVWGLKVDSGEEFEVASEIEAEFWPEVSPDGKSILFQTNTAPWLPPALSQSSVTVKSLVNQPVQQSFKGLNPRWLPDSRRIAFLRRNDSEQKDNLWTFNTINGEEKQITENGVYYPAFAILPNNRSETGQVSWSPDGRRFAYLDSRKENVWASSIESPTPLNQTNNGNPKVRYNSPLWSPDGKQIALVAVQKPSADEPKPFSRVLIFEQGKLKEVFSTRESLRLLGWSASGSEIFLEATDGAMKSSPLEIRLLAVSVTGGNSKIVTIFKNTSALSMKLSADGKMVAFTSRDDERDNIWIASTNDGAAKKLTVNGNPKLFYGSPAWSPDGKTIFFDKQEEINTISMFENFK